MHLSWEVEVDPESVLALDWERQQRSGVVLVGCSQGYLTLDVPHEHATRLLHWQFVTLSSKFHDCQHLAGRHLYHRVLRVANRSTQGPVEKVTLSTEELSKASQVFHSCSFSLAFTPPLAGSRRLSGGPIMMKPKDKYDKSWSWNFSAPMPFNRSFNKSLPHFASETWELDARKLAAKVRAQLNYSSNKSKEGASHMEYFRGQVDFDLDIDADARLKLKVMAPNASKGMPSITESNVLEPVALCQNITVPLGAVPLTILPEIDLMRLKVQRTGLLEGSFNFLLNANLVSSLVVEFNEESGMEVKVNATFVKGSIRPPVFVLSDQDFSLEASLMANLSVHPFFKASFIPKFNISVSLVPGNHCKFRDVDFSTNVSMAFQVQSVLGKLSQNFPRKGIQGLLSNLLPKTLCEKGFCKGVRPGCNIPAWRTMYYSAIPTLHIVTNRTLKRKDVPAGLGDAVGYGLSMFPDEVKVVDSFLQNQSSEEQVRTIARMIGKPLGEAAQKLADQLKQAAQRKSRARRLGDGGEDHEEVDAFVLQLTKTRFEITDELLQHLLHYGAFRIHDGRESMLGGVRITSIRLLQTEPLQQELWDRAGVHGVPAVGRTAELAVVASALTALALVGLTGARARGKRHHYGLAVASDAA